MSDNHEPPRMKLADVWPEEGLGPLAANPLEKPHKIVKPTIERQRCLLCEGEMLRSRVRFYERPWVMWSKTRPYRCMECGVREWRAERR